MWSGPRNVSTALMYSFAQRDDTRVLDEPLYGHYLKTSGAAHPGRDEVIAAMECDGDAVMRRLVTEPLDRPILFAKQMAHHLVDVDRSWLERADNFFLIRDPFEMLPSLAEVLDRVRLGDTGLENQVEIVRQLEKGGRDPFCIDSRELLLDPPSVLRQACERLSIPFQDSMLSWPAGPRPEDGVWAKYWYDGVHRSTGFQRWRGPKREMPEDLLPLFEQCRELYEFLFARALKAQPGENDVGTGSA